MPVCKVGYWLNCGCNYVIMADFYLRDSLLAFPVITGVAFTNSPFHTSYSKILGTVITVGAFNLVLLRGCTVGEGVGNCHVQQTCQVGAAKRPEHSGNHREVIVQL